MSHGQERALEGLVGLELGGRAAEPDHAVADQVHPLGDPQRRPGLVDAPPGVSRNARRKIRQFAAVPDGR